MSKPLTLSDIATLAGVSSSTASRALQDSPLISAATKRRVQEIASQQGYRPNVLARNLRLQRSQTVVYVLPFNRPPDQLLDPFLSRFLGAVAMALRAHDYDLLISQAEPDDDDIGARYVLSGRADGIVFLGRSLPEEHFVRRMAAGAPMVAWGPPLPDQPYCSVGIDNRQWSEAAVAHLIAHGRRRIAFLGEDPTWFEVMHRYDGYGAALAAAGLKPEPALVAYMPVSDRAGQRAMRALLVQAPDLDAVFANSDVAAIAAMQALRESGRRVPDDVAVIGFDNIDIGAHTSPALTTVSQNLTAGVPLLIDKLLRLIGGETVTSETVAGRLVVRQSCGAHGVSA